jgi:alkyldihydroxyacetonephosphate synthase
VRRSYWGWGYEDKALSERDVEPLARLAHAAFGASPVLAPIPPLEAYDVPAPSFSLPRTLERIATRDPAELVRHSCGASLKDVLRKLTTAIPRPPDYVLYPEAESEIEAALEFAHSHRVAVVPYGGGSSVVGGVDTDGEWRSAYSGVLSIDISRMARLVELDEWSLAARFQAGVLGPAIEEQLRPYGLTLRHFPQSFECSSLGGWVATRSGGHYATQATHIDDLVESVRVLAPSGILETRRLPASGAGPDPNRSILGSEGTLGIITEAWVRVQRRPAARARAEVSFKDFLAGAKALKELVQAGFRPANCRVIDDVEAALNGVPSRGALMFLSFESPEPVVDRLLDSALELLAANGGDPKHEGQRGGGSFAHYRESFMRAPYVRDAIVRLGLVTETFETAVTWDRLDHLVHAVKDKVPKAIREATGKDGLVAARITHAYPDGAAPYFTVVAAGGTTLSDNVTIWEQVKQAASETVISHGATITHHHAVGRDHVPWFVREQPPLWHRTLGSLKSLYDPGRILNPGVLGL